MQDRVDVTIGYSEPFNCNMRLHCHVDIKGLKIYVFVKKINIRDLGAFLIICVPGKPKIKQTTGNFCVLSENYCAIHISHDTLTRTSQNQKNSDFFAQRTRKQEIRI